MGVKTVVMDGGSNRVPADGQASLERIAVYGEFGGGNFGNDASLDGLLRVLAACGYAAGELMCFSRGPEVVRDVHGVPGARIGGRNPSRRLGRFQVLASWLERLRDLFRMWYLVGPFRIVIVPGTGIVEDGVSSWSIPLDLFWLALACRLRSTQLVLVCVGVGVPRKRVTRFFFRSFLRGATYRSYRDQQSKRAAAAMGVAVDRDAVYADLAFGLPRGNLSSPTTTDVGLGLIAYAGGQSRDARARAAHSVYVANVIDLVNRLVAGGRRVRLLIGDQGDQPVVEEVLRGVVGTGDSASMVSVMQAREFSEVVDGLASCDVLVASRFHNLVGAALARCPTIALGYSPKHPALQEALGLAEFEHDIGCIDVDQLVQQIEELTSDRGEWRRRLEEAVSRLQARVELQRDDLRIVIGSSRRRQTARRNG